VFGSNVVNIETYKAVGRLVGHRADVSDLCWSLDNLMLASCSVDGRVLIWNTRTFDQVKELALHTGFVKGVAWDPLNHYLASQSDDGSVKVWRVQDWGLEKTITKPYEKFNQAFTTRLSWSPDGNHLATANAASGSVPVSSLVLRTSWSADVSFVGHALPVEVACFNPRLFKVGVHEDGTPQMQTVCAIGSQDNSVSVWTTANPRAIVAARDLFQQGVSDMSWSPDGLVLYASSRDGHVVSLTFSQNELGESLSSAEKDRLLQSLGYQKSASLLPETPEQLQVEKDRRDDAMQVDTVAVERREASMELDQPAPAPVNVPIVTQQVTITKEGKKRVQPTFVRTMDGVPASYTRTNGATRAMDDTLVSEPSRALPPGGLSAVVVGIKRKEQPTEQADTVKKSTKSKADKKSTEDKLPRHAFLSPEYAASPIRLAVPKVRAQFNKARVDDASLVVECHNRTRPGDHCKITCTYGENALWTNYVPGAANLIATSAKFTAVAMETAQLHLFLPSGKRYTPYFA
jgi:protein HIRA/HIR1